MKRKEIYIYACTRQHPTKGLGKTVIVVLRVFSHRQSSFWRKKNFLGALVWKKPKAIAVYSVSVARWPGNLARVLIRDKPLVPKNH